jgi:orotate phosphoribosyltransferase
MFGAQAFNLVEDYYNPESFFKWACGVYAPVYTDCRRLPAQPGFCAIVVQAMVSSICSHFSDAEGIIGVESSGIVWSAMIGQDMAMPVGYVRKASKEYGMKQLIEGFAVENSKVVVIDDAIVSGESALKAVNVLQNFGMEVIGVQTIMNANLAATNHKFERLGVPVRALISYSHIVEEAKSRGIISEGLANELSLFYADPFHHKWDYDALLNDYLKKKFRKTA